MEFKYLVMVNPGANNNKFYRMIPKGNMFTVEYGRVGNGGFQSRSYPDYEFNKKYQEKVNKGYTDQTHLYREVVQVKSEDPKTKYKEIDDVSIRKLVDDLMNYANLAIQKNYTISSEKVTKAMVDEAQYIINKLSLITNVGKFNEMLIKLFTVIPRKMGHVDDYMARTASDMPKILEKEQDLLDVMRTKVFTHTIEEEKDSSRKESLDKTILEMMGLKIKPITAKEEAHIRKYLGSMLEPRFVQAFRVENKKTRKRLKEYQKTIGKDKKIKEFWHGSRNENWWNILNTGLMLRPNAVITGKMFGYGLYFANKAAKSLGYTSTYGSRWAGGSDNRGYLAIFDVLYGEPYVFDKNWKPGFGTLNYEKLQDLKPGADSFHAIGGSGTSLANDEIIVYKEEQATIKYIVELRG